MTETTRTTQLEGELLSPKQAASYLGVSAQIVRRWVAAGEIEGHRLGYHTIRIPAASIEKFMQRRKPTQKP